MSTNDAAKNQMNVFKSFFLICFKLVTLDNLMIFNLINNLFINEICSQLALILLYMRLMCPEPDPIKKFRHRFLHYAGIDQL